MGTPVQRRTSGMITYPTSRESLSAIGRSASGGKVRKLEGSKVERVSGYGFCGLKVFN
jgi:hypothetical protein